MKIIQALKSARRAFTEALQSDKTAAPQRVIPCYSLSAWGFTMEACLSLSQNTRELVRAAFETLDEDTQHALTFTPKNKGGWVHRAQIWRDCLSSLPARPRGEALEAFYRWYRHCLKMKPNT